MVPWKPGPTHPGGWNKLQRLTGQQWKWTEVPSSIWSTYDISVSFYDEFSIDDDEASMMMVFNIIFIMVMILTMMNLVLHT